MTLLLCAAALAVRAQAAPKIPLPRAAADAAAVNDLPVPYNLQAVVLDKAVTLTWSWTPPEKQPAFVDFGFEVARKDGKRIFVSETTFSESGLAFGTYAYRVRLVAGVKTKGKRVTHVSDWSEPVSGTVKVTCGGPPSIDLAAVPTQRAYSTIPSLRLHLTGSASVPEGCHLGRVSYHVDSGTGIVHDGTLKTDAQGRFDAFVDAVRPEDEPPGDGASFVITASAEDEAGPVTSAAYTIDVQLQNRFAPKNGY